MLLFNAVIGYLCAGIWTYLGFRNGFDVLGVVVVLLWLCSGIINTIGYIRTRKKIEKR